MLEIIKTKGKWEPKKERKRKTAKNEKKNQRRRNKNKRWYIWRGTQTYVGCKKRSHEQPMKTIKSMQKHKSISKSRRDLKDFYPPHPFPPEQDIFSSCKWILSLQFTTHQLAWASLKPCPRLLIYHERERLRDASTWDCITRFIIGSR